MTRRRAVLEFIALWLIGVLGLALIFLCVGIVCSHLVGGV